MHVAARFEPEQVVVLDAAAEVLETSRSEIVRRGSLYFAVEALMEDARERHARAQAAERGGEVVRRRAADEGLTLEQLLERVRQALPA